MDIYIKDKKSGRKIRLPVLPEKIEVGGQGRHGEYEIMNIGEYKKPQGKNLDTISFTSLFPGETRRNEPWIKEWQPPTVLHDLLNLWRKQGNELNIIITGTSINYDVLISSYSGVYQGGHGDIYYTISFVEMVKIAITSTKTTPSSSSNRPSQPKSNTYTVKKGDCLWKIAQKFYGKGIEWKKIYNANKAAIEATAKKHGYKSSDNGWWIFPNEKLTIP